MSSKPLHTILLLLVSSLLSVVLCLKECTNVPTQLSSHSMRAQLSPAEVKALHEETHSHMHLTPTDEATWMDIRPRKLLNNNGHQVEEFDWLMLYRSIKESGLGAASVQDGESFLSEVPLHDVQLAPDSVYGRAQQTNLEYLLLLDVDQLVWSFRKQAGLATPGTPYGGWEKPDVELRGHFVGHYMSATAKAWASMHNETLFTKMNAVVDVLYTCQKTIGTGYLSAFPDELFDRFEAVQPVWAPYYTIHKIMAGLLDQYTYAGNSKALGMVTWMADYFANRVKNVIQKYSIERHYRSLNEETGGMNDVLYRLYTVTKDEKHLILAHLFDKPCFLGLLAVQADSLSGFHTNTHIPVVIGAQMRYEVTGDHLYKEIGTFFMDIVNSSHAYATGGTSVSEFWYNPKRLADMLTTENEESCTTYNMLKIMQGLLDQYTYAQNSKALEMVKWMAEYFANHVKNVIQKYSIERHYTSLNEETGGMNDILYQLYTITKDEKHLILAHLFDKPCFLGLLAVQADSLSNFHSNTHIPIVVGAQKRYEVTGDPLYKEIGIFFMDIVNSSHAYATGGTSVGEYWLDPKRLADKLSTETQESCTTYNMLKVSRNLFRWTKEVSYADYYERSLINGVLSIQRGSQPGVMIYMLPMKPDSSKAVSYHGWGTKFNSFWCCYGTGIESFSKLGDSIYFEEKGHSPSLYIIQFIPSTINWRSAGLVISQEIKPLTSSDLYHRVSLTISSDQADNQTCTLNIRIPSWTSVDSFTVTLNSNKLVPTFRGQFLSIKRSWDTNENLVLEFPIGTRTEQIKDDRPKFSSLKAFLFGPYLLAGLTRGNRGTKWSNFSLVSDQITPVPKYYNSQVVSLTQQSSNSTLFISTSNVSLTMQEMPRAGTPMSLETTFRIYHIDSKNKHVILPSGNDSIVSGVRTNVYVMIEPFDMPGSVITNTLNITSNTKGPGSTFRLVPGLDGTANSISLELGIKPGCYISTGKANYACGKKVLVLCKGDNQIKSNASFKKAASFVPTDGNRHYDPISFVAKGLGRNFILEPLTGLRDEFYTVYFNVETRDSNKLDLVGVY